MSAISRLVRIADDAGGAESYQLNASAVSLGRDPANDIDLLGANVSRFHARIERLGGGWSLVDLQSTNGTFVNRERVEQAVLRPGDVIHVGDVGLRLEAEAEAEDLDGDSGEATRIDDSAQLEATLLSSTVPVKVNEGTEPRIVVHTARRTWELGLDEDAFTFGRDRTNEVVLDLPNVSRHHARIERRAHPERDAFVLRDLESTNGTWLGAKRVEEHRLENGDTVRIGDARITFKDGFQPTDLTLVDAPSAAARRPVVFIPGIMGSQLWLGSERVWPNVRRLFSDPAVLRLPDAEQLEVRGIVDEVVIVPNLIRSEQYSRLSSYLVEALGYERGHDLLEFAYDWRRDLRHAARRLTVAIETWDVAPPITIIAHSLGALVARYYVERLGGAKVVGKLLLMGGPHQGAPGAISTLVSGPSLLPFGFMGEKLREVLATFPSAYQILPREGCVADDKGEPIDLYREPLWLPEERRAALGTVRDLQRELPFAAPSVPTVCIFGYNVKTTVEMRVERSEHGLWQRLRPRQDPRGDGSVPETSTVLPHVDIHPVEQHHGSLFVDNDVRMRLKVELTW